MQIRAEEKPAIRKSAIEKMAEVLYISRENNLKCKHVNENGNTRAKCNHTLKEANHLIETKNDNISPSSMSGSIPLVSDIRDSSEDKRSWKRKLFPLTELHENEYIMISDDEREGSSKKAKRRVEENKSNAAADNTNSRTEQTSMGLNHHYHQGQF